MIQGIEYLHRNNIIHGDLKGVRQPNLQLVLTHRSQANILITPSKRACIVDFGFATLVESSSALQVSLTSTSSKLNGGGGTIRWLAPELLGSTLEGDMEDDIEADMAEDLKTAPPSDIYAYACICYEVTGSFDLCFPAKLTAMRSSRSLVVGDQLVQTTLTYTTICGA